MAIADSVCDAIDIIVNNAIQNAGFDKTIQATISACVSAESGKYRCKYQDAIIYAYSTSADVTYSDSTYVYILVPNGDLSSDNKTILGTVSDLGSEYGINSNANICTFYGENSVTNNTAEEYFSLCSYTQDSSGKQAQLITLYEADKKDNKIVINNEALATSLKQSNTLYYGATFKTALNTEQMTSGNYGIAFQLSFYQDSAKTETSIYTYTLDIDNFLGNPYKLFTNTEQYNVNILKNGAFFNRVEKISIFCEGFPNIAEEDIVNDIFIKDIMLLGADFLDSTKDYDIQLTFPNGSCFYTDDDATEKTVNATVYRKGVSINLENEENVAIYWFKENASIISGSSDYNSFGGQGWECLNVYDSSNQTWFSSSVLKINESDSVIQETNYKCVFVYGENSSSVSRNFVIENKNYQYVITIVSSAGLHFSSNTKTTTLTCTCTDKEGSVISEDALTYSWIKINEDGSVTDLYYTSNIYEADVSTITDTDTYKCIVCKKESAEECGTGSITIGPTAGIVTSADTEYYISTSNSTLEGGEWSTDAPTGNLLGYHIWSRTKFEYSDGYVGYSATICLDSNDGSDGPNNYNNAIVILYTQGNETPSIPSKDCYYDFTTKNFYDDTEESSESYTEIDNWSLSPSAGESTIWITTAIASGKDNRDYISKTEWSTPMKLDTNDYNIMPLFLYKWGNESVVDISTTTYYDFSDKTLYLDKDKTTKVTEVDGWKRTYPTADEQNKYQRYFYIHAIALSQDTTDEILYSDWSDPEVYENDKYITKIEELYYCGKEGPIPSSPTTIITQEGEVWDAWTKARPGYVEGYIYYTCSQIYYNDSSIGWSDVVEAKDLTDANANADDAKKSAEEAKKIATNAKNLSIVLSNENHTVAAENDGTVSEVDLKSAATKIQVYYGNSEKTQDIVLCTSESEMTELDIPYLQITSSITDTSTFNGSYDSSTYTYTISTFSKLVDNAYVDFKITYMLSDDKKIEQTSRFTLSKSKAGVVGEKAKIISISATAQTFMVKNGAYSPSSITLTANPQNCDFSKWYYYIYNTTSQTWEWKEISSSSTYTGCTASGNTLTITGKCEFFNQNTSFQIKAEGKKDNIAVEDIMTIFKTEKVISNIDIYYQTSSDGVNHPSIDSIENWSKEKVAYSIIAPYLWVWTHIVYDDGTSEDSFSSSYSPDAENTYVWLQTIYCCTTGSKPDIPSDTKKIEVASTTKLNTWAVDIAKPLDINAYKEYTTQPNDWKDNYSNYYKATLDASENIIAMTQCTESFDAPVYACNYVYWMSVQREKFKGTFSYAPVTEYIDGDTTTKITKNTITTSYVNALGITATSITVSGGDTKTGSSLVSDTAAAASTAASAASAANAADTKATNAAKTATNYITNIDSDGIKIARDVSTAIGRALILNGDGMHLYSEPYSGTIYKEGNNEMAHLGWSTNAKGESGTINAPYYTLGTRLTSTIGGYSVAEGVDNIASGYCSHAEGYNTTASGYGSHAEGSNTIARGYSHAEGYKTIAVSYSHAEGYNTTASGGDSHAEGYNTTASGYNSHAEGYKTIAGPYSHAEGESTTASGYHSHAGGYNTTATMEYQTAIGTYNEYVELATFWALGIKYAVGDSVSYQTSNYTCILEHTSSSSLTPKNTTYWSKNEYPLFMIGNGTSDGSRSNVFEVDTSGNVTAAGNLTLGNRDNPIGTYVNMRDATVTSSTSINSGTWTALTANGSFCLAVGVYIIFGRVVFPANSNGSRGVSFGTLSGSTYSVWDSSMVCVPATNSGTTSLVTFGLLNVTSNESTYSIMAYQNSGSSMSISDANVYLRYICL